MWSLQEFIDRGMAFFNGETVARAELDAVSAKLEAAEAKLKEAIESGMAATASAMEATKAKDAAEISLKTATEKATALEAEVTKLKAEAKTVDEESSRKAREICQAQGIASPNIPAAAQTTPQSKEQELARLRAEMLKETDPEKKSAMATKCRELRGHADIFTK